MAYATLTDMTDRFGSAELIRLTTPSGEDLDGIVTRVAETALSSASVFMDGYIGRRYRVPMDIPPPVVTDLCCDIARYKLSTGDQKTCAEEVRTRYQDATRWLDNVSVGKVVLELAEIESGSESYAQVQIGRCQAFGGYP